jgi:hypothetical protein
MQDYEIISINNSPSAIEVIYINKITNKQDTKSIPKNTQTTLKTAVVADLIRSIEDLIRQIK